MSESFIRECEMTNESGLHTDVDVNLKTGTGTYLFKAWEGHNIKTAKDLLLIKLNKNY